MWSGYLRVVLAPGVFPLEFVAELLEIVARSSGANHEESAD
jgi:hypothetical protein